METFATVPKDIQKWITAEAEAVQIILTWSDNDSYSTVDAYSNALEMWKAIEMLKQVGYEHVVLALTCHQETATIIKKSA
uniref:Uncharacterized protein n=1 Tax=Tanacetum cinerariifolium TaxID=118510 RepID=A0A6L2LRD5_TANCI|nr:hypothetical protein [Tanacetum cinerariifolium]